MRIVLIDDDPISCESIKEVLSAIRGLELHIFNNSEDAWVQLDKGLCPVLFLLDHRLVGETGVDILIRLRSDARFREHPVMLLTADAERETIQQAAQKGVTGYILKPAVPATVLRIKTAMREWYLNILEDPDEVKKRLRVMTTKINSYMEALLAQTTEALYQAKQQSDEEGKAASKKRFEACKTVAVTMGAHHLHRRLEALVQVYEQGLSPEVINKALDVVKEALALLDFRWRKKIP